MLESIKKLREYAKFEDVFYQDVLEYADEIEREISEKFARIPIANTGVPAECVRTCELEREPGSDRLWWCSFCESYHEKQSNYPFEYCPRCGAKVVSA